jgi:hypothetical protein
MYSSVVKHMSGPNDQTRQGVARGLLDEITERDFCQELLDGDRTPPKRGDCFENQFDIQEGKPGDTFLYL